MTLFFHSVAFASSLWLQNQAFRNQLQGKQQICYPRQLTRIELLSVFVNQEQCQKDANELQSFSPRPGGCPRIKNRLRKNLVWPHFPLIFVK